LKSVSEYGTKDGLLLNARAPWRIEEISLLKTPNGPSPEDSSTEQSAVPSRLPYAPPKLRRLGSVRELTLGSKNGPTDGAGGKQQLNM